MLDIDTRLKPYLMIAYSPPIEKEIAQNKETVVILKNFFNISTRIIAPYIPKTNLEKASVVFVRKFFSYNLEVGNIYGVYLKHLIIYDLNKLESLLRKNKVEQLVAVFLEELVHCYFNIRDEDKAAKKVIWLLQQEGIQVVSGANFGRLRYDSKKHKYYYTEKANNKSKTPKEKSKK